MLRRPVACVVGEVSAGAPAPEVDGLPAGCGLRSREWDLEAFSRFWNTLYTVPTLREAPESRAWAQANEGRNRRCTTCDFPLGSLDLACDTRYIVATMAARAKRPQNLQHGV
jgi:hypothetical protein